MLIKHTNLTDNEQGELKRKKEEKVTKVDIFQSYKRRKKTEKPNKQFC